jgi:signal transduction histidine kinase
VWSQSAVPVFTVESEIAYLSAFTNSITVEISRLDAITANKMKSDFISSISRKLRSSTGGRVKSVLTVVDEFRSPLHGILASADFLRDSDLDSSQIEFVSTIQNCSGTLLVGSIPSDL